MVFDGWENRTGSIDGRIGVPCIFRSFMFAFIGFLLDFILIGFRRVNNRYLARGLPDRFPQNFFH